MTTTTMNAHGTKIKVVNQIVDGRLIQIRMQLFNNMWVQYAKSSHLISPLSDKNTEFNLRG